MKAPKFPTVPFLAVLLAGALGANVLLTWRHIAGAAGKPAYAAPEGLATSAIVTPGTTPPPAPQAFNWAEVESDDFPTYISNLRQIGCPEITIRRIVSAELDEIYAASEGVGSQRGSAASDTVGSRPSQQRAAPSAQRGSSRAAVSPALLEKQRLMVSLFPTPTEASGLTRAGSGVAGAGDRSTSSLGQASAPSALNSLTEPMQERPVSIPLALKQSAAQALGSPDAQVVLGNIKDEFINNIGGPNQDPTDPNYIKRWRHAQSSADEELRKMLGTEAYNRLSALALLEANSKANAGSGD